MSPLRIDPLRGHAVVFAAADRPVETLPRPDRRTAARCPLCAGGAAERVHDIRRFGPPDAPVRVVPDGAPLFRPDAGARGPTGDDPRADLVGAHEVIVEHPRHDITFDAYDDDHAALVVGAWRERLADLRNDRRLAWGSVVRAYGADAGARLDHPHAQVFAADFVPRAASDEVARAADAARSGRRLLAEAADHNERTVAVRGGTAIVCPEAPIAPYETWIVPSAPLDRWEDAPPALVRDFAVALGNGLRALRRVLGDTAVLVTIHTLPYAVAPESLPPDTWRGHVRVRPFALDAVCLERAGLVFVHPITPETAAADLRRALADPSTV